MATTVNFNDTGIRKVGKCTVYVRDKWEDDWQEVEHLHATEIVWSCQPAMPTASLRWDYGRMLRPNSIAYEDVAKLDWKWPKYAKIVAECQLVAEDPEVWSTRTWYGVLQISIDQDGGVIVRGDKEEPKPLASGQQTIVGYGLEHLLSITPIMSSAFSTGVGVTLRQGLRETFNRDGLKNCSVGDLGPDYKSFYYLPEDAQHWNTKEIVRYLLGAAIPEDPGGVVRVPFRLRSSCYVPDWDRPEVSQENATVLSLLNNLLHRGRLLNWWLEVVEDDPDAGGDVVELVTQTILKEDLFTDLPPGPNDQIAGHTIPKSTRQLHLTFDVDKETTCVVKDSGLPTCDQVVVRGRPLQYVCTVGFSKLRTDNLEDWSPDWTPAEEEKYRTAASGDPNYAALSLVDAQRANAVSRSRVTLEDVFSRFKIPADWNGKDVSGNEVFAAYKGMQNIHGNTPWVSWKLMPNLPLYYGFDYATHAADLVGQKIAGIQDEPENDREYLPILLFFARPDTDNFVLGQEMGRLAELGSVSADDIPACTAAASVGKDGRSLRVRVSGKPQHVIAGESFVQLPEDDYGGVYDYQQLRATVALENGLHIEHRYPDNVAGNVDLIRVHEIRAADHYEEIYLVGGTAVDVTSDPSYLEGLLTTGQGVWIERPREASRQLAALAKIAYAWYSEPHRVVSITTTRLKGDGVVKLGDLVVRVGDNLKDNAQAVDCVSPITELRISWAVHDGPGSPTSPNMTITTSAGELDPLNIQAPPPVRDAQGVERRAFDRPGAVNAAEVFGG